jgi:hypothetical protein
MSEKGDTKQDIDKSMKDSGVDEIVKKQADHGINWLEFIKLAEYTLRPMRSLSPLRNQR